MKTSIDSSCDVVAPVFLQHRDILLRYIKSKVRDTQETEELVSQVMLKVYNHCEKLEHIRNTEAWLITIARNTINDYFKERQVSATSLDIPTELPEEELNKVYEELETCIPPLMKKLPEKYGNPLMKYELKGVSQKQLAIEYNMSESGLKSRIQRARIMLKNLFKEHCGHMVEELGCNGCNTSC